MGSWSRVTSCVAHISQLYIRDVLVIQKFLLWHTFLILRLVKLAFVLNKLLTTRYSLHASKAPKSSKCRYFLKILPIELKSGSDLIFCAASLILKAKIKKVNSFGALRLKSKHNTSSQKV